MGDFEVAIYLELEVSEHLGNGEKLFEFFQELVIGVDRLPMLKRKPSHK